MGSRLIESAAYGNQILLAQLYITVHKTHRLIESFGYCYRFCVCPNDSIKRQTLYKSFYKVKHANEKLEKSAYNNFLF